MRRYVRMPLVFTIFAFLTVLIMGSGDCNESWTRLDACTADYQCEDRCWEECGDLGVMFATCNATNATCNPCICNEPGRDGAIESIHYSFDGKALEGSRQASLKALAKQDGQWFWTTNLVLIDEDGWVAKNWTDDQLEPFSGGALNLEDGTPITFGFYTGASHTVGVPEVTRNTGVDNWRVVICKQ